MRPSELRTKSETELAGIESDLRKELGQLFMARTANRLEKPARVGQVRKDLARVLTVLGEKRKAAASEASS